MSISALVAKGATVGFATSGCNILCNGHVVAKAEKCDKLYVLPFSPLVSAHSEESAALANETERPLWHARLGHVAPPKMIEASRASTGIPSFATSSNESLLCEGCACGKMHTAPFAHTSGSVVRTSRALELVHTDVMGPLSPKSKGGARFVVTFVDDFSRFVSVNVIKAKSDVTQCFIDFTRQAEAQTGLKLKCVRSDNGGEYVNRRFNGFCTSQGIIYQTTVPYTPQQNGLAERMNRTLVEMARSMLYYQHFHKLWWAEAVMTAAYILNRIPNSANPHVSPIQLLFHVKPDLQHLRVFGARGFVFVDKAKRTKLDPKAHACIFLGYAVGSKGYRVWDLEAEKLVISRTIQLQEQPPSELNPVCNGPIDQGPDYTIVDDDAAGSPPPPPNYLEPPVSDMEVDSDHADDMDVDSDAHRASPLQSGATSMSLHVPHALTGASSQQATVSVPPIESDASSSSFGMSGMREEGENRLVFKGDPRSVSSASHGVPSFVA